MITTAIVKKSLSDQIYDELKQDIINQKIPFGSKLVNKTIQERYNVSSSPVRDAINRLYADGLIENISKAGAFVVQFDSQFYLEVNEILMLITSTGIKLSFQKADKIQVVEKLRQYLNLQKKYIASSKYFIYDYKFHKTFIDFSNNSRLKKLYKQYNVLHEILLRCYYEKQIINMQKDSIKTHEAIIEAFLDEDIQKCTDYNENHYKKAEEMFKEMFEQNK